MKRPLMPQTTNVYTEPSRFVLAVRLGTLTALIALAIGIMTFLASALAPAESSTGATTSHSVIIEPLGTDLQTLAESVIPDPPDLSPNTTDSLSTAVTLVLKPAALGDYGSALINLETLQSSLNDATASRTGTHFSRNRATIIQNAIDTVRTDLQSLQESNVEAG